MIDKVGGVDINVPEKILSNKFDCPYKTQARCDRWQGWRFAKGHAAHEREAGARLLADPREQAQSGARATSPAPSASRK